MLTGLRAWEAQGLDHQLEVLRAAGGGESLLVFHPVRLDQLQQSLVKVCIP